MAHCKAPQQHALHCCTPCFPAHALFAACRRRQPRTLRCARQTRCERSPAACSPNLRAQTSPSSPPPPFLLQLHKGFIYASAHLHDVDAPLSNSPIRDGCTPVGIDAGFEVAPGEQSDFEVANAHGWGSLHLVFSDGTAAWSALRIALQFPNPKDSRGSGSTNPNPITIIISKRDPDNLKVDSEQRVRSMYDDRDVLLRKRA